MSGLALTGSGLTLVDPSGANISIGIGSTVITGGSNGDLLYNANGTLGGLPQSTFATLTGSLVSGNVAMTTTTGVKDSGVGMLLTALSVWGNNTNSAALPSALTALTLGSGAISAPTYSFFADATSGLYMITAGVVGVQSSGKRIMQVQNGGTLGGYLIFDANNTPSIAAAGLNNTNLDLSALGTGGLRLYTNNLNQKVAEFLTNGGTTANNMISRSNIAGSAPTLGVEGTDTNVGFTLFSKGGGNLVIQTSAATQLTVTGTGSTVLGNAAIATGATDGFLYAVSGAGTPTGTPTTFTGRVPVYVDTTNSQLWLYMGGGWKQPKTPAAAALITWQ